MQELSYFLLRFQSILSFLGAKLLCRIPPSDPAPGRSYTQQAFSSKRMDPLSNHASVLSEANRKHSW